MKGSSRIPSSSQQCRNSLRISDGDGAGWDPANITSNSPGVIALFCGRDRPPPLCERHLMMTGNGSSSSGAPPCLAGESFTSKGPSLSVQQHLPDGTAFSQWRYALAYEFFRVEEPSCDRVIQQRAAMLRGSVKSPQNVFLFGRGGAVNLRFVFKGSARLSGFLPPRSRGGGADVT